jgi:hypothetical protein
MYHDKISQVEAVEMVSPHQGMDVRFPSTAQGPSRTAKGNSHDTIFFLQRKKKETLGILPVNELKVHA